MKTDSCDVVPADKPRDWHGNLDCIFIHAPETRHKIKLYKQHRFGDKKAVYHFIIIPYKGVGKKQLENIDKNLSSQYELACDQCHVTPSKTPSYIDYCFRWNPEKENWEE